MKIVPKLIHMIILILGMIILIAPFIDSTSIPSEAYAFVIILWGLYMLATPISVFKSNFYNRC